MQRYWWPGYEKQLLGELQRQQNSTQFCDTLLQTEGISVPTHSCILAALSPYLSQKLSASPSPPSGQKRQLQLQPVKAQTLLKLVGLMYSGEVEVKGSVEQNDVLAVARLFGIRDLVEGQKNCQMEGELQEKRQLLWRWKENSIHGKGNEQEERRKMQDAQVQAEMAGRRDMDSPAENRHCVTTGTQTCEKSVYSCVTCFSHAATPESVPSVAQNVDCSIMLQPQNITFDEQFCSTSCPVIPSVTAGSQNDATLDQSSCSVINLKSNSDLSRNMMTLPISLGDDSNSPPSLRDNTYWQSSVRGNNIQVVEKKTTGPEDGQTSGRLPDTRENTEKPHQASREETLGEESGVKSTEKRHLHASVGTKNLAKMKQMQQTLETTQISIKVKLRRRTKGEVWEVVSPQDTDETSSVFTSHKQDAANQEPQANVEPLPSTVDPDTPIVQPQPNISCNCQPPSSHRFVLNQRDDFGTAPLPEPQGSVEESDEEIEKLLDDIMMGLNILPNLEKDCNKSHHLQPSHNEVSICQLPVTQNDVGHCGMQAAVSAAGCLLYQNTRTSSEAGIHCCLTAQNQPDTSSSAVQPDAALTQQQCPPQYHSSVRFMGQRDGASCESMPLSKSQECLHPEAPTAGSVLVSAFSFAGHKQHDPAFQELPRQDNEEILEYVPTVTSIETQSLHSVSLLCMDDLRIRQCLSPLEPCTSATKHQTVLNQANCGDNVHPQSSLHGRLWLTENPVSVQFPLGTISHMKNKSTYKDWLKQQRGQQDLNPQNWGNWAESCTLKEVEARESISDGKQDVTELKSDTRKMKERNKQDDTAEDAVPPKKRKRMYTGHLQDAASLSAYKNVRAIDGKRGQINFGVCSVSLSSNNVLAKEREIATSSLNDPSRFIGKSAQPSSVTERLGEKTKESEVNADRIRIRTRGFMKKTQESPSNTSPQNSVSVPACRSEIVNNREAFPRRKRGRPPKSMVKELILPDHNPIVIEKSSDSRIFSKEDSEEGDKTKKRHIKKKGSTSTEVKVKTVRTEHTKAKVDANNNIIPTVRKVGILKRPRMVSLKEFQRLIQLQHWKTRKSKEIQETNGIEPDAESEGIASGDSTCKESSKKNHNHIFPESAAEEQSQQDNTDSSTSMDTSSFGDSPVFPCDVLQKEVPQLADERELPLKIPDEGKSCDGLSSDTTQETAIRNERSFYTDPRLPQENRLVSDHNLYTRTAGRTGSNLPVDGGMSRTSDCDQEEEEVDVLLFSPDRAPKTSECENALNNMEISPDDEEEEDVNEIDVTGDEAE